MSAKPYIFFGSSKEASGTLETLAEFVVAGGWAVPRVWIWEFTPGQSFLQDLLHTVADAHYAVMLYGADDLITSRGRTHVAPRDNVLFECGLFMSRLGPERTALVMPRRHDLKIMSDIAGHSVIEFDIDGSPRDCLRDPALRVRNLFREDWAARSPREEPIPTKAALLPRGGSAVVVPVFRNANQVDDWYKDIERSLRASPRSIDHRMLYYGPGLARNWLKANRELTGYESRRRMLVSCNRGS